MEKVKGVAMVAEDWLEGSTDSSISCDRIALVTIEQFCKSHELSSSS